MNYKITLTLILVLSFFSENYLVAQSELFVDNSFTADQMVMDFFDSPEVNITNVSYTGNGDGLAFFEGANTNIGIPAGILLSTGNVFDAVGPNDMPGTSGQSLFTGEPDLEAISSSNVFDSAILEFDISSTLDTLLFSYVFGSEEYPEFNCSVFNDVFGFFVSGSGINGPFSNNAENIALVPGTNSFVAINSINSGTIEIGSIEECTEPNGSLENGQFYVDNENGIHLQADGFTTPLPAPFTIVPGETYHIKLAIADVGDSSFDSSVFIGIESLNGEPNLVPPAAIETLVDGNMVSFENNSRYATSYLWDFGDGNFSTERNPAPYTYQEGGTYEIFLTTQNYCCNDTTSFTVEVEGTTNTTEISTGYQLLKNPVQNFVELNLTNFEQADIALFNTSGQELISKRITDNSSIDIQNLPNGIYYLQVNINGKRYLEKVVKI